MRAKIIGPFSKFAYFIARNAIDSQKEYIRKRSVVMEANEKKNIQKFVCFMSTLRNVMRPRGCQFKIGQKSGQTKVFALKFCVHIRKR